MILNGERQRTIQLQKQAPVNQTAPPLQFLHILTTLVYKLKVVLGYERTASQYSTRSTQRGTTPCPSPVLQNP